MEWEINFLYWLSDINQNSSFDWLSTIMKAMSLISELGLVWVLIAITFVAIKQTRKLGITLSFGLFFFAIFVGAVGTKLLFQKIRPIYANDDLLICVEKWFSPTGTELFDLWCVPSKSSYSFVSTRAFTSFLCSTIIIFFNRKMGIASFVLAVLVSFSRIYFGLVYPIDSILGAFLGSIFGVLSVFLSYKFYDKIIVFIDDIFQGKPNKK